ncbi:putative fatty acid elongase 4 [Centruroides vittatus]|uniref:putative fatty acid elongase 4 n=1 Tax=Centruroides vittatus TaxID=120091 RepID=UPI0035108E75
MPLTRMKRYNISEPFPVPFDFETVVTVDFVKDFFRNYWHYSIYISVTYLIAIVALQQRMKSRHPYDIRRAFVIWNGFLASFSICTTLRIVPIIHFGFKHFTFYDICCDKQLVDEVPQLAFWGMLFLFSKVWELGDTLMIVLSKKKLMFLHCYHHVTVLIMSWYSTYRQSSFLLIIAYVNLFVHSFMYTYFTTKCLNIKISRRIVMFVTAIQTIQMIIVCAVSCWIYWILINGHSCDTSVDVLKYYFILFFSYLYLFLDLFYKSYVCRSDLHKKEH